MIPHANDTVAARRVRLGLVALPVALATYALALPLTAPTPTAPTPRATTATTTPDTQGSNLSGAGTVQARDVAALAKEGNPGHEFGQYASPEAPLPVEPVIQPQTGSFTDVVAGTPTRQKTSRLIVPGVGINAPITTTGVVDGQMALPDDVSKVSWLNITARPGDLIGSSVISGHVSDTRDTPGALWNLKDVKPGMLVKWRTGGRERTFVITGAAQYPRKGRLPSEIFDVSSDRALYIVTCTERESLGAGRFHYTSNLIVKAVPYGATKDRNAR